MPSYAIQGSSVYKLQPALREIRRDNSRYPLLQAAPPQSAAAGGCWSGGEVDWLCDGGGGAALTLAVCSLHVKLLQFRTESQSTTRTLAAYRHSRHVTFPKRNSFKFFLVYVQRTWSIHQLIWPTESTEPLRPSDPNDSQVTDNNGRGRNPLVWVKTPQHNISSRSPHLSVQNRRSFSDEWGKRSCP